MAVWHGELPDATHSSYVLRLIPDPARLLPDYLAAWLRHPLVRRRVEALTTASPMSLDRDLLNSDIELPSLEEQQRLVDQIARLAAEQADRRIQHDKAVRIREGLAGRLLGGPLGLLTASAPFTRQDCRARRATGRQFRGVGSRELWP